jgi:uncharacterized integral membrane protein (TIGR00698 family)
MSEKPAAADLVPEAAPAGWPVARARALVPGVAVAFTVAAAATYVSEHNGGPVMLYALLIGMALAFLAESGPCGDGIRFTAKVVLRLGVALLGLRISLAEVVDLGLGTIELVVAGIAITIGSGLLFARLAGAERGFGLITGGAVAICGASAALALSAAVPKSRQAPTDAAFAVIAVTTLSTLAMILYPSIARSLGLDDREIGIFLGATIHDVAQVVGAGYAVSETAGHAATVTKLLRVAFLLPIVLLVGLAFARSASPDETGRRASPIPGFAVGFAALVAVNSLGVLPAWSTAALSDLSRWCLVAAIAAIGLTTRLEQMAKLGWRPALVVVGETLVLMVFVLAALVLTR